MEREKRREGQKLRSLEVVEGEEGGYYLYIGQGKNRKIECDAGGRIKVWTTAAGGCKEV